MGRKGKACQRRAGRKVGSHRWHRSDPEDGLRKRRDRAEKLLRRGTKVLAHGRAGKEDLGYLEQLHKEDPVIAPDQ